MFTSFRLRILPCSHYSVLMSTSSFAQGRLTLCAYFALVRMSGLMSICLNRLLGQLWPFLFNSTQGWNLRLNVHVIADQTAEARSRVSTMDSILRKLHCVRFNPLFNPKCHLVVHMFQLGTTVWSIKEVSCPYDLSSLSLTTLRLTSSYPLQSSDTLISS